MLRILGLDPGLRHTGWGLIDKDGPKVRFIAAGVINPDDTLSLPERLAELHEGLKKIITEWKPDEVAVEETFVQKSEFNFKIRAGSWCCDFDACVIWITCFGIYTESN